MNRKNIPILLMLAAGAATFITACVRGYSLNVRLMSLFAVLVLFYLLGSVLIGTLGYFERKNEEKLKEEGTVIEKELEEPEPDAGAPKQI